MERVTINEIAKLAGVSKGAVSYALNGRPGVSAPTRERILAAAQELGWAPNRTARLLSSSRTDTFGLVLARNPRALATEPFYLQFIAGLEGALTEAGYSLLLQVSADREAEIGIYRNWSYEHRVDGVVVLDLYVDDARIPALRELGMPAVMLGDPAMSGGYTTVWTDESTAMEEVVDYFAAGGHRTLARIAGMPELSHVQVRDQAFVRAAERNGQRAQIEHSDLSAQAGREITRTLLSGADPPTAIFVDGDLMAGACLSAVLELGISVPGEVSVATWDNSPLCDIAFPELSTMSQDVGQSGAHVARRLLGLLTDAPPGNYLDSVPTFSPRGSTGPAAPGLLTP